MQRPSSSDRISLLSRQSRPSRQHLTTFINDRQAELAATFGSDDDDDDGEEEEQDDDDEDDNGRRLDTSRLAAPFTTPTISSSEEVFFDAGEALASDPLGAQQANQSNTIPSGNAPPYTPTLRTLAGQDLARPAQQEHEAYNFEDASYFTPSRPRGSRTTSVNVSRAASPGAHARIASSDGIMSRSNNVNETSLSRMRIALGRFGRLVGMRVPGATYSSLNTEDENGGRLPRSSVRGVVGGGMGQDGVFANMNAKPERRRRRGEDGEDRGDDDDLVDDVLPPTYETAAADVAPPYWETTIIGGPGGLHPLAPGGMGWTPGGANVGAIEDLIVDGLPVGNFFGFAWNLLVSMSFQFVGFLLTYLLHTTHAARCGSRAGLGITLVQYGFYLRTRAMQIAEGKLPDDGLSPLPGSIDDGSNSSDNSLWWSKPTNPIEEETKREWIRRGISFFVRQTVSAAQNTTTTSDHNTPTTLADLLASDDNTGIVVPSAESVSASTEWLAYVLMGIGWFILLSSVLSYWRVHRWGRQLVEAARRESERDETADELNNDQQDAPVGFLSTLRRAIQNRRQRRRSGRQSRPNREHSAEDWIIFPGRHRGEPPPPPPPLPLEEEEVGNASGEERLLQNMRSVGLLA